MSNPLFLTRETIEELHLESLRRFGGSQGLRDPGLIESALASAQNTHLYADGDAFEIAAAYAYHIAQAQAYLDGNKRTAVAAALVFLSVNGLGTAKDDGTLYDAMIALAEKRLDKAGLARVFRRLFTSAPG
jgi:death-on-curing protein